MDIDTDRKLNLDASAFIGQRVAVLGISGSGKTNTAAVLVEELRPHTPMTIVDIEGEMWGLKEKFDWLVAGRSTNADVLLTPERAPVLAYEASGRRWR